MADPSLLTLDVTMTADSFHLLGDNDTDRCEIVAAVLENAVRVANRGYGWRGSVAVRLGDTVTTATGSRECGNCDTPDADVCPGDEACTHHPPTEAADGR